LNNQDMMAAIIAPADARQLTDICTDNSKLASRGSTGNMSMSYRPRIAGYTMKRKAPPVLESADSGAIHRLNHLGTSAI
jgi:hypothetical protein